MTDANDEMLNGLNQTLTSVENELLRRKVDRDQGDIEHYADFVSKLADDGVIDVSDGSDGSDDVDDEEDMIDDEDDGLLGDSDLDD